MSQVVITVDTIVSSDGTYKAQLESVKNSQGVDITSDFRNYCSSNNHPLDTQQNIEKAAAIYAKAKESVLP